MGSLASRPKAPTSPQIVYVPSSTTTTDTTSAAQETRADMQNETSSSASALRKDSLLTRSRSHFGTVKTSFRGILDLASGNNTRKTLLGE